jgi:hypothetical protein
LVEVVVPPGKPAEVACEEGLGNRRDEGRILAKGHARKQLTQRTLGDSTVNLAGSFLVLRGELEEERLGARPPWRRLRLDLGGGDDRRRLGAINGRNH